MKFASHIIAVGRMKKASPYAPAYAEYENRLDKHITLTEIEGRDQKEELAKIKSKIDPAAPLIALDETGKNIGSIALAQALSKIQTIKSGKFQFIIGGADGLDDELRHLADLVLSFGQLTWPHMLARVMLIEQIYRANLILANHPYHREGQK